MVPRKQRLSQREFSHVWGKGKTTPSPFFVVRRVRTDNTKVNKYAVVVSKKTAPKAVMRNLLRRRVYAAIHDIAPESEGVATIVVVRKDIRGMDPKVLREELMRALG